MRRIVLDMKGGLLAEAVMQSLSGCDPDFLVYLSSKPEETLALCRTCRANVLVMEVIRQGIWKLSERLKLCKECVLLPFHNGVFKIAQKASVPIVVASIQGTEQIHKNWYKPTNAVAAPLPVFGFHHRAIRGPCDVNDQTDGWHQGFQPGSSGAWRNSGQV